jgi:hypothetical protein
MVKIGHTINRPPSGQKVEQITRADASIAVHITPDDRAMRGGRHLPEPYAATIEAPLLVGGNRFQFVGRRGAAGITKFDAADTRSAEIQWLTLHTGRVE